MRKVRRIRRYQQIASKMLKTRVLQQDPFLRRMIPETLWYTPANLAEMLERYRYRLCQAGQGWGRRGHPSDREAGSRPLPHLFPNAVQGGGSASAIGCCRILFFPGKRYLIQQGIQLMLYRGSPFDLRILLQKPHRRWIVSGMVAKVAASGRFVTNYSRGGHPLPVETALATVARDPLERERLSRELHHMAERVAVVLNERFPGLRELGIDVGVDQEGRLRIFEVNTRPQFKMFSKIGRRDVFARIMKYHRIIV